MVQYVRQGVAWSVVAVLVALLHPLRERVAPAGVNLLAEPLALRGAVGLLELLLAIAVFSRGGGFPPLPPLWRRLAAAWLAAAALSVLSADLPLMAFMRLLEWLLHGAAALALWYLLDGEGGRDRFRVIVLWALPPAMAMLMAGWMAVPSGGEYNWLQNLAGFVHLRFFGVFLLLCLPFWLVPWLEDADAAGGREGRVAGRWIGLAGAVVTLAGLAWAAGRGPYLALAATIPLLAAARLLPGRALGALSAAALLGTALSVPFWDEATGATSTGLDRFLPQLTGELEPRLGTPLHQLTTGRDLLWGAAWQAFLERPLLGWGPDGYRQVPLPGIDPRLQPLHPHNGPLQLLVEWGIAGTALLALLAGGWLRRVVLDLRAEGRRTGVRVAALWSVLLGLALALVSGTLYHPWPLMFLFLCAAVASPPPVAAPAGGGGWRWSGLAVPAALLLAAHLYVGFLVQHPALSPAGPWAAEAQWVRRFPSWVASYPFQVNGERWLREWEERGLDPAGWRAWYRARRYHGGPLE